MLSEYMAKAMQEALLPSLGSYSLMVQNNKEMMLEEVRKLTGRPD